SASISYRESELQCVAPESACALASVPDLQRARERKSNDALDLSPNTSGKSWRDRDLSCGLTPAVCAVQCSAATGLFRTLFHRQTAAARSAVDKGRRQVHKHLWPCQSSCVDRQLVRVPYSWVCPALPACA